MEDSNLGQHSSIPASGDLGDAPKPLQPPSLISLKKSLLSNPSELKSLSNLAVARFLNGDPDQACVCIRRAIYVSPGTAISHRVLSKIIAARRDRNGALKAAIREICLDPGTATGLEILGVLHKDAGALHIANRVLQRAVVSDPSVFSALDNRYHVLKKLGKFDQAAQCLKRMLEIAPEDPEITSSVIFRLDHLLGWSIAEGQDFRRKHWARHEAALQKDAEMVARSGAPSKRSSNKKLRIGYVSADFRGHSAFSVFGPVILNHDRNQFEILAYSNSSLRDEKTEDIISFVDVFRDISNMSDIDVARQIKADSVDILIDLSSHSAGNRLPVFSLRPAKIQIAAWGYAHGTGLSSMDYFIMDEVYAPPEAAEYFSETLIYLPSAVPFMPPNDLPDVADPPVLMNKVVTFGSFNRGIKITKTALGLWTEILHASENTRLLLKCSSSESPAWRHVVESYLQEGGIDPARLTFLGRTNQRDHLDAYRLVDIALDTSPDSGGVTTWEALSMGVPVVSFLDDVLAQRVASSILNVAGLPELIAAGPVDFVRKASDLSRNVAALRHYRQTLRHRVKNCDATMFPEYTRFVEEAYRRVHHLSATGGRTKEPIYVR